MVRLQIDIRLRIVSYWMLKALELAKVLPILVSAINRRGAVVKGVEHGRRTYFDNCVSQHLSGAGSSPAGSVGRDLNLQKLNY